MPRRRRNPEASTLYFGAGAVLLAAAAAYLWWQKSTASAPAPAPALAPAPAPQSALPRWEPSRSRQSETSARVSAYSADGSSRFVSKAEAERLVASGVYMWNAMRDAVKERPPTDALSRVNRELERARAELSRG